MGILTVPQAVYVAFASVFMVKSVISNFCIILVIVRNKAMHTTTNIFILNLAVSDIVMGGVILPQMVHDISHTGEFHEGEISCRFVTALPIFCITSSIYSLVVMAVERYRAICTKSGAMTKGTAKKLSVGCWVLATLVSIPTFAEYAVKFIYEDQIGLQNGLTDNVTVLPDGITDNMTVLPITEYRKYYRSCGNVTGWTYGLINGIMIFMLSYFGPLIMIFVSYINVALFIHQQAKQQEAVAAESSTKTNFTLMKNKVRVIKMLVVVAGLFAISWAPYFVLLLIAKITGRDGTEEAAGVVNLIRLSLSIFSVSYNVYLYLYFTASFRAGFKELLCPYLKKRTESTDNKVAPESTNTTTAGNG